MSARTVLMAVVLSAWLVASIVAFLIVAYTTFFGIAFIGLVICYVSTQFELDGDRPVANPLTISLLGAQLRAQEQMTAEQRRSVHHNQSLCFQSARFFKSFGFGLLVVGLCGGLYYQI